MKFGIPKETVPNIELPSKKEWQGHNTNLRFTFVRHSQKSSGQVFAENKQEISTSNISEAGKERAQAYGSNQLTDRKFNRIYATDVDRTKETLLAAFQATDIDPEILQKSETTKAFFSLPQLSASKKFNNQYEEILLPQRQKYLDEHYPEKKFNELTPDEQEIAAEYAEEPALEWYLSFDDRRPDEETPSPREQAASVAFKINRLVNLPDYMPGNKSVDLISAGHKTSTEAFLKYVIERKRNEEVLIGFDTLEEIGGSLKILDSWDLQIHNDDKGEKHIKITLRRENGETQEYGLNMAILNELAKEYIQSNNIQPIKLDSLKIIL